MIAVNFAGFDYLNSGTIAEIKRNVTAIIETPEGSCPGDRSYGIPQDFVSMPLDVARNLSALAVIEKLEIYEPRAELREVTTQTDAESGRLINTFLIGPSESYEENEGNE